MRFKRIYLSIALFILLLELAIATLFSSVEVIRGSIGDILAVALLYYLMLAFYRFAPAPLALAVFAIACAIETGQYFHVADALHLERGSILRIAIGTTFSWADVAMYALGAIAAFLVHRTLFREADDAAIP